MGLYDDTGIRLGFESIYMGGHLSIMRVYKNLEITFCNWVINKYLAMRAQISGRYARDLR